MQPQRPWKVGDVVSVEFPGGYRKAEVADINPKSQTPYRVFSGGQSFWVPANNVYEYTEYHHEFCVGSRVRIGGSLAFGKVVGHTQDCEIPLTEVDLGRYLTVLVEESDLISDVNPESLRRKMAKMAVECESESEE
jgi:hypothetical protein